MRAAFSSWYAAGPLIATAVHAGHDLRPAIARLTALDGVTRRREEDPFTDQIIEDIDSRFIVHRSRFEVDLNRVRERAVYSDDDESWGLQVWRRPLPPEEQEASLTIHDEFYATLAGFLDRIATGGPFLLLDVHSYNHRRDGAAAPPARCESNPEVNVGTRYLYQQRWAPVISRFMNDLAQEVVNGHRLDVRENVRFRGGYLSQWVSHRYPTTGCTLAVEFKKVFMDEWTGAPDRAHIGELRRALTGVASRVAGRLRAARP